MPNKYAMTTASKQKKHVYQMVFYKNTQQRQQRFGNNVSKSIGKKDIYQQRHMFNSS